MSLTEKYDELLRIAKENGVSFAESNGVLKITGEVGTSEVKNKMWAVYDKIDPNFKSGDVVLNVKVNAPDGIKLKVVTQSTNLNIRKGPGTDQPVVGKAAQGEIITLVGKANDQWWLVRDAKGNEGYCYSQYLEPINN